MVVVLPGSIGLLWVPMWSWMCFPSCLGAAVGYHCVVLAMIGPRTTQGLLSPVKVVIVGFAACMQWLAFRLCGVGLKVGYA